MQQNQASIPIRKQCSSLLKRTKRIFLHTTEEIKGSQRKKRLLRWLRKSLSIESDTAVNEKQTEFPFGALDETFHPESKEFM